jgi:hypothetical protein
VGRLEASWDHSHWQLHWLHENVLWPARPTITASPASAAGSTSSVTTTEARELQQRAVRTATAADCLGERGRPSR